MSFRAKGHPSVLSTHPTTIEVTKEIDLTPKGDCIVAVCSGIGARDLPDAVRLALSRSDTAAKVVFGVGQFEFTVHGEGHPGLTLSHPTDLVIRRSGFVSDRTLMIHADKSAVDLPRDMVRLLQDPRRTVTIQVSTSTRE